MSKVFKCAVCGDVFESTWSDEEAMAELAENVAAGILTHVPGEELDVICDDCHELMMADVKAHPERYER